MLRQSFIIAVLSELNTEVQVTPESVDVQIFSPLPTAASLVPSLEEVMLRQFFELPTEVSLVQVAFTGVRTLSESRATSRTLSRHRRGIVSI